MCHLFLLFFFFFFNDTATTEIYTLSLHDALPISCRDVWGRGADADTPRDAGLDPEMDRQSPPGLRHDDIAGRRIFRLPWRGGEQYVGEPQLAPRPARSCGDVHAIGVAGNEARAPGNPVHLGLRERWV